MYEHEREYDYECSTDDSSSDDGSDSDCGFISVCSVNYHTKDKIAVDHSWYFGCNRCYHCDGDYRHSKVITVYDNGLEDVEFKISHARCQKAYDKMKKAKQRALDEEFNYFYVKMDKHFYKKHK